MRKVFDEEGLRLGGWMVVGIAVTSEYRNQPCRSGMSSILLISQRPWGTTTQPRFYV